MTERPVKIAPSILSADFATLGADCAAVETAGADWIHVDVMDGHYVPNITFGPAVCKAIRPHIKTVIDVHLMIAPADPYLRDFAEAGADIITVHAEAGPHLDRSLQAIRGLGCKAGVAPATFAPITAAGADVLVAGSAVFKGGSAEDASVYAANVEAIRSAAADARQAA